MGNKGTQHLSCKGLTCMQPWAKLADGQLVRSAVTLPGVLGLHRRGGDWILGTSSGFWMGSPSWQRTPLVNAGVAVVTAQAAKCISAALASRRGKSWGWGGLSKEVMAKLGSEG